MKQSIDEGHGYGAKIPPKILLDEPKQSIGEGNSIKNMMFAFKLAIAVLCGIMMYRM